MNTEKTPRAVWWCSYTLVAIAITTMQVASAQDSGENRLESGKTDASVFYRPDEVQSIELRVQEKEWKRMLAALPERISVKASFRWREISFDNVSIRFKGNSSSAPSQKHKRSFLVKFDEYDQAQRFLEMRRVSFDNGVQFGSLFSEPIITEILQDRGLKTHRCNYAKLTLNDQYQGVYVNVERIDEVFIERHFPGSQGLLFKVDEGGPGSNLQFIGNNPSSYTKAFEPQNKVSTKGKQKLVEFIQMINQLNDDEITNYLESQLELDDLMSVTAVMLLSGAFDQLTGWNPHNYYLYHDGTTNRWNYFPWDLDVGFCETAFGQIQVLKDWNAAWPVAGQLPNPLLDRIFTNPTHLQKYRDSAKVILEKYFEPEHLCAIIDAKYELIKSDLKDDPFPHRRSTNPEDRSYVDIIASMKQFVRKRYTTASEQLKNPGKRPAMSSRPGGPPPELIGKIQRIQRAAEQMQRSGQDVVPIQKVMQKVGPLLQQAKMAEADKLINEALKLVGDEPGRGNESPP